MAARISGQVDAGHRGAPVVAIVGEAAGIPVGSSRGKQDATSANPE
jgi:hypothetical protein